MNAPRGFGARGTRNGIGGTNGVQPDDGPTALDELRALRDYSEDAEVARICRRACRRLEQLEGAWRNVVRIAGDRFVEENEK